MSTGRWIAYVLWVGFVGVVAYVAALGLASSLFGIGLFCLFEETGNTADAYRDGVASGVIVAALTLVALGARIERRSTARLAWLPTAAFAVVVAGSLVAAGIVGHQPCVDDGSLFSARLLG